MCQNQVNAKRLVAQTMLVGSLILLLAGLMSEGLPVITPRLLLILAYLSLVSGALGFTLWTWSQKELTAFESSSINNLMLIEIALMDFLFFQRSFTPLQLAAILLVFGSILAIQRKRTSK
jgi:drug/metabolite transporter (DMT)-like permease